jgi:hypothetical protein
VTDRDFRSDPSAIHVPWYDSPFFEAQLAASDAPEERKELARAFRRDGFVVARDLVPPELIDAIVARYPWLFDPETDFGVAPSTDAVIRSDPRRRQDAWFVCEPVKQLACLPAVLELLQFLYGRRPLPFQTLNFEIGSEQPPHADSIHFDCIPSGYMCGVWVALEDMTEENGPLVYYPKSHRLPRVRLEQLGLWPDPDATKAAGPNYALYERYIQAAVDAAGLEPLRLLAPKGSLLIWSSDLVHGGTPIVRAGATRMSQVTHYYFEGCSYYAPILSNAGTCELALKPIYDISRSEQVPHTINGQALELARTPDGRFLSGLPGNLGRVGLTVDTGPGEDVFPRRASALRRIARKVLGRSKD